MHSAYAFRYEVVCIVFTVLLCIQYEENTYS